MERRGDSVGRVTARMPVGAVRRDRHFDRSLQPGPAFRRKTGPGRINPRLAAASGVDSVARILNLSGFLASAFLPVGLHDAQRLRPNGFDRRSAHARDSRPAPPAYRHSGNASYHRKEIPKPEGKTPTLDLQGCAEADRYENSLDRSGHPAPVPVALHATRGESIRAGLYSTALPRG